MNTGESLVKTPDLIVVQHVEDEAAVGAIREAEHQLNTLCNAAADRGLVVDLEVKAFRRLGGDVENIEVRVFREL